MSLAEGQKDASGSSLAARVWKPLTLAALAVWLVVVGSHHEPWFDEIQAWLLARDSSLWQLVAERVRYEGTPPLWHMLLWACIRLGLPFAQFYLVSTACAVAGAAIVLWRAPFPPLVRIGVVASYFFAFQFGVVARSYALDLVFIPALAALFAQRTARPLLYGALIGLLAACNAHSFLVAGLLGLEFAWTVLRAGAWRETKALGGLALAAGLGLLALWAAWQPADNAFLDTAPERAVLFTAGAYLSEALIDRPLFLTTVRPDIVDAQQGLLLSLLVLVPCIAAAFMRRVGVLALALVSVLVGFAAAAYASPWHAGILYLVWIFLLWISWPAADGRRDLRAVLVAAMALVCVVQAGQAIASGLWDINNPYSGSKAAAQIVAAWRDAHPQGRVAGAGFKALSIQPYFDANVFGNYHDGAPQPAYMSWKRGEPWPANDSPAEAGRAFAAGYGLVVVSWSKLEPEERASIRRDAAAYGYRAIALTPGHIVWKRFQREDNSLLIFERQTGR